MVNKQPRIVYFQNRKFVVFMYFYNLEGCMSNHIQKIQVHNAVLQDLLKNEFQKHAYNSLRKIYQRVFRQGQYSVVSCQCKLDNIRCIFSYNRDFKRNQVTPSRCLYRTISRYVISMSILKRSKQEGFTRWPLLYLFLKPIPAVKIHMTC